MEISGFIVTPEYADSLYYKAYAKGLEETMNAGQTVVQSQINLAAMAAVLAEVRKHYQDENERLREENRTLKASYLAQIESDAKAHHASP